MNTSRLLWTAGVLVACSSDPGADGSGRQPAGQSGTANTAGGFGGGVAGAGAYGSGGFAPGGGGIPMGGALGSGGSIPLGGAGGNSMGGASGSFGGGGMASDGSGGMLSAGGNGAGGMVIDGTGGMIVDPGTGGSAGAPPVGNRQPGCEEVLTLPPASDYGAKGPYPVTRQNNTGPSGQYTLWRPTTLGADGLHPPVSWGNGVTTTPDLYVQLLETVASHGYVVIASNSATMTAQLVRQGFEWLLAQNGSTFENSLAVDCGAMIGYSMGGGSAVGAGAHPATRAIVSMHGLPAASTGNPAPLLLITSTDDDFVSKSGFVQPAYQRAAADQPTIMATLQCGAGTQCGLGGHLIPLGDAGSERAPLIAWLRLWVNGDDGARPWFYGASCTLCSSPWVDIERKNHSW